MIISLADCHRVYCPILSDLEYERWCTGHSICRPCLTSCSHIVTLRGCFYVRLSLREKHFTSTTNFSYEVVGSWALLGNTEAQRPLDHCIYLWNPAQPARKKHPWLVGKCVRRSPEITHDLLSPRIKSRKRKTTTRWVSTATKIPFTTPSVVASTPPITSEWKWRRPLVTWPNSDT